MHLGASPKVPNSHVTTISIVRIIFEFSVQKMDGLRFKKPKTMNL